MIVKLQTSQRFVFSSSVYLFRLIRIKEFSSFVKVASEELTSWMKNLHASCNKHKQYIIFTCFLCKIIYLEKQRSPVQRQRLFVDDIFQSNVCILHVAWPVFSNTRFLQRLFGCTVEDKTDIFLSVLNIEYLWRRYYFCCIVFT